MALTHILAFGLVLTRAAAQSAPVTGIPSCKCSGPISGAIPRFSCDHPFAPGGMCVTVDDTYGDIAWWKTYAADYGTQCQPHMEPSWAACFDGSDSQDPKVPPVALDSPAGWCNSPWCYVDPCKCDAPDMVASSAFASHNLGEMKYSYATCGAVDTFTGVIDSNVVGSGVCTHSVTCAAAKAAYKESQCCGNPAAEFDENALFPKPAQDCIGYCMTLTVMDAGKTSGMATPEQDCYYPVSIPALIAAGEKHYTYLGQSHTNEHAPDGAFVYKMDDGSMRYKKIDIVAPVNGACAAGALTFSCDHTLGRLENFYEATEMAKAMRCSSDVISVAALLSTYTHYAWIQMAGQGCGSFVYQRTEGLPLVHKTCG